MTIIVLESFGKPRPTTNPYLQELVRSFPSGVRAEYFSWKKALTGRYDVFHIHWPEVLLRGTSPIKTAIRCVAFLMLLIRIRVTRTVIVRTLHNAEPHETPNWFQQQLLRLTDRWTTLWITLSTHITTPDPSATVVIPHGHYRDWYATTLAELGPSESVQGRMLNIGLVRPYKGVEGLLDAFAGLEEKTVSLRIVGKFMDDDLAARIRTAIRSDTRVAALDEYVDDARMAAEVSAAELVVLPFNKSTNSGSMLLALSLNRPVLVPAGPVTNEVADEVGPGWVHSFVGQLTAQDLSAALRSNDTQPRGTSPDLSGRDWPLIGELHAQAFARALSS